MTTKPPNSFHLGVIILGGGASLRMGKPKLLLPWGDTSILGHLLRLYKNVNTSQVAIVCSHGDTNIISELNRLAWPEKSRIFNPQVTPEMFSSVLCGFHWDGWQPEVSHLAVALGDQPLIREKTIANLIAHARQHPKNICQPVFENRRRHPVIIPRHITEKASLDSHNNLREVLNYFKEDISVLPCDDPGLVIDIDTPNDYEAALLRYSKR